MVVLLGDILLGYNVRQTKKSGKRQLVMSYVVVKKC